MLPLSSEPSLCSSQIARAVTHVGKPPGVCALSALCPWLLTCWLAHAGSAVPSSLLPCPLGLGSSWIWGFPDDGA